MSGAAATVVLVVEDEILVRMSIADHLRETGFEVLEAGNADEAIDILAARFDITIMFTDVDMPGSMDGLKLAAAVRHRWPPIRIVLTSGHHLVEDRHMPGEALFFRKPYNPERLISTFRDMARG
jgi:CheY-like chemotaxis protein